MKSLELFAMWQPSFFELMVIMTIALLLFGKRLPDVARSLGKGVVEFKKGLKGIEDDAADSSSATYSARKVESPPQQEKLPTEAPPRT